MENERPTPLLEDTEGTRRKLESWLSEHRGHDVSIPHLDIPEATGMSKGGLYGHFKGKEDIAVYLRMATTPENRVSSTASGPSPSRPRGPG